MTDTHSQFAPAFDARHGDTAGPPAMAKGSGRRTARTRERLIAAARRVLINEEGAAEIGAIAKAAGVSAGIAYHHFGSKDGLIAAVVEDFYARYAAVANARYPGASWAEREIQRTRAVVAFLVDDTFTPTLFGALSRASAVVNAESACMADLVEHGAHNIARGQDDGDLPRQSDPALAAAFVLGGMRQAVTAALLREARPEPVALARQVWILIASSLGLRVGSKT